MTRTKAYSKSEGGQKAEGRRQKAEVVLGSFHPVSFRRGGGSGLEN
jgi:hypothetical protein